MGFDYRMSRLATIETIMLPPDHWSRLEPVVRQFGNTMPSPQDSGFLTALDGEKVAGFIHVESLYHFVCEYIAPGYEGSGLSRRLIQDAASCIPVGRSGIWLTDRKVDHIAARVGARHVGNYRVYRKDR